MKKIAFLILLAGMSAIPAVAQKFAFVDTEYILNKIPAYKSAQGQIDKLSADWQKEIEGQYAEIEKLFKNYQAEKVMLSEDMRKKREDEIVKKEQAAKEIQQKYFGSEGELTKKQQELVKPIQDEVYRAVKELAVEGGYAAIFDTASDASVLYASPKQDRSDEVLEKMGYKN
ncbi:MAG: OmpH family outer membrane protein [Bacteroidales bacterium]|jgi:outer membrane protein|nr:OmpH family outer membrane protein [Bacteroidales bacterium]